MRFAKKLLRAALATSLLFAILPMTASANQATATPSAHTVMVDGETVAFRAFLIDGSNFFMLRDIAYVLSGSNSQFEVSWDESAGSINLLSGARYTSVGGEMQPAAEAIETATVSTAAVLVNGSVVSLRAYNIRGNNFFMLRDLGDALGFGVDWDADAATVVVDTGDIEGLVLLSGTDTDPRTQQLERDEYDEDQSATVTVRLPNVATPTPLPSPSPSPTVSPSPSPSPTPSPSPSPSPTPNPRYAPFEYTTSRLIMQNRRQTETERQEWINEYRAMGGPSAFEREVFRLTNEQRRIHGLNALEMDYMFMMAARFYTQTLANLNLPLGHNEGPYGGSGSTVMSFGSTTSGARNGMGGRWTPEDVVNGWMNSSGHRANILREGHVRMGVGSQLGGRNRVFHYMVLSSGDVQQRTLTSPVTTPTITPTPTPTPSPTSSPPPTPTTISDLTMTVTPARQSGSTVSPGERLNFTISVTNTSQQSARVSLRHAEGQWSGNITVPAGQTAQMTANITIPQNASHGSTVSAGFSGLFNNQNLPTQSNTGYSFEYTVYAAVNLTVSAAQSTQESLPSRNVSFQVTVTNTGTTQARNALLRNTATGATVAHIGSLAPGATRTVNVNVNVPNGASGSIVNSFELSATDFGGQTIELTVIVTEPTPPPTQPPPQEPAPPPPTQPEQPEPPPAPPQDQPPEPPPEQPPEAPPEQPPEDPESD